MSLFYINILNDIDIIVITRTHEQRRVLQGLNHDLATNSSKISAFSCSKHFIELTWKKQKEPIIEFLKLITELQNFSLYAMTSGTPNIVLRK